MVIALGALGVYASYGSAMGEGTAATSPEFSEMAGARRATRFL